MECGILVRRRRGSGCGPGPDRFCRFAYSCDRSGLRRALLDDRSLPRTQDGSAHFRATGLANWDPGSERAGDDFLRCPPRLALEIIEGFAAARPWRMRKRVPPEFPSLRHGQMRASTGTLSAPPRFRTANLCPASWAHPVPGFTASKLKFPQPLKTAALQLQPRIQW